MDLFVFTHVSGTQHDPGPGHPEAPIRLKRVLQNLEDAALPGLSIHEAPRAERAQLTRVHSASHVATILDSVPTSGWLPLDGDTFMSPATGEAALRAAGGAVAAVDAVMGGNVQRAFSAMRPPGHHAETATAMGFCFFDNIAVAAAHALEAYGLAKVAVIDFDVHHGNGTQAIFEAEPRVMYASIHEAPLFPGTGRESDRGVGNIVNACVPSGTRGPQWRQRIADDILPELDRFAPELVLISAGFDAHAADPLANIMVTESDFSWVTAELVALANLHAQGRVVSALEGGYDPDALARSVLAHLEAMMQPGSTTTEGVVRP